MISYETFDFFFYWIRVVFFIPRIYPITKKKNHNLFTQILLTD